jgi:hypothetical protein
MVSLRCHAVGRWLSSCAAGADKLPDAPFSGSHIDFVSGRLAAGRRPMDLLLFDGVVEAHKLMRDPSARKTRRPTDTGKSPDMITWTAAPSRGQDTNVTSD